MRPRQLCHHQSFWHRYHRKHFAIQIVVFVVVVCYDGYDPDRRSELKVRVTRAGRREGLLRPKSVLYASLFPIEVEGCRGAMAIRPFSWDSRTPDDCRTIARAIDFLKPNHSRLKRLPTRMPFLPARWPARTDRRAPVL